MSEWQHACSLNPPQWRRLGSFLHSCFSFQHSALCLGIGEILFVVAVMAVLTHWLHLSHNGGFLPCTEHLPTGEDLPQLLEAFFCWTVSFSFQADRQHCRAILFFAILYHTYNLRFRFENGGFPHLIMWFYNLRNFWNLNCIITVFYANVLTLRLDKANYLSLNCLTH